MGIQPDVTSTSFWDHGWMGTDMMSEFSGSWMDGTQNFQIQISKQLDIQTDKISKLDIQTDKI